MLEVFVCFMFSLAFCIQFEDSLCQSCMATCVSSLSDCGPYLSIPLTKDLLACLQTECCVHTDQNYYSSKRPACLGAQLLASIQLSPNICSSRNPSRILQRICTEFPPTNLSKTSLTQIMPGEWTFGSSHNCKSRNFTWKAHYICV